MVLCPSCNAEMKQAESYLKCVKCLKLIRNESGFITNLLNYPVDIHEGMSPIGLDNCYKIEQDHFWYKYRRKLLLNYFTKFISLDKHVLEIGAGTGNIARELLDNGYNEISIGEIHENGLDYAITYGIKNLYQFDVTNAPFHNHFDAIGMFDVLEHISEDKVAIENISKMLKNDGLFILTVPAHMWLWCREDQISFHKKRYEISEIVGILKNEGFDIVVSKTFFIFILPLLYLRKIFHPASSKEILQEEIENYNFTLNPIINKILWGITLVEDYVLNKIFNISMNVGGSILIVAKKSGTKE